MCRVAHPCEFHLGVPVLDHADEAHPHPIVLEEALLVVAQGVEPRGGRGGGVRVVEAVGDGAAAEQVEEHRHVDRRGGGGVCLA